MVSDTYELTPHQPLHNRHVFHTAALQWGGAKCPSLPPSPLPILNTLWNDNDSDCSFNFGLAQPL